MPSSPRGTAPTLVAPSSTPRGAPEEPTGAGGLGLTELVADALAGNLTVPLVLLPVLRDVTRSDDGPETTHPVRLEPATGTRAT